ncbi:MAG: RNA methyltransferase [Nitrospinota bacterium]|nr:RNA methyltransferase [Nitrospinota bacterium]MDH5678383.1 RNA methyltransferase [Nitrospinota bacterium]
MNENIEPLGARLAVGLVHHPVVNRSGNTVTSSVTSLDVHDLARVCRTYGVGGLYIVTPLEAQARLVERIIAHWTTGYGSRVNPERKEAMRNVKVVDTIEDMMDNFGLGMEGAAVMITSARPGPEVISYSEGRQLLERAPRAAVLFGTAHGLAGSALELATARLAPIPGMDDYNHLPVRSAASIILDRLLGRVD